MGWRLTREAERDLAEIARHTVATFGPGQAQRYAALIERGLVMLSDDPFRPSSRARDELAPTVRSFHLSQAAVQHMGAGSSIINTASINADKPNPSLLAYATTKGAIQNFTAGLAQLLADRGIRVNCVAPGPVWTPLIPSSMPAEKVAKFGQDSPMKRPAQPVELATAYVMLAEPMSSYVSGATIAVTGGAPML